MTAGVFANLTKDGKSIVLEVSGDDYELDQAAKALRGLTPLLKPTVPKGGLVCPATWAAVTQLACTFNGHPDIGKWMPMPRLQDWIIAEFEHRHIPLTPMFTDLPAGLTPRGYQNDAAGWIASAGKFLLFDDPGVGKTVSAILGLKLRATAENIYPMVIIVPSWDVGDVWVRHIRTWAPEWPEPVLYSGPGRFLHDGIHVTTYATARIDAPDVKGPLARLKANSVVADEVHYIKNESAKQSRAVRRIAQHAGTFVGLSGTPVTRDTGDVYPVLAAMEPDSWPDRHRFVKRYLSVEDTGYSEEVTGLNMLREPEFRTALAGQYRRVAKSDVLSELPPKVHSTRRVDLPPEWRKAYKGMEDDMLAELPDGEELEVMSVLAQLTRLSQFASSATDVQVTEEIDEFGEVKKHYKVTLVNPSWKVTAMMGVLAERPGQQSVVFAESRQLIDIAGAACEAEGYKCGFITGTRSQKDRTADIESFQNHQLDVMLATSGAGSLGITLTAAGTAVFLQRSWQLDKALQPEDRLHRIGQEHDCVEIIDIIARDTVDDRVRELLRVKGGHLGQLVKDPRIVRELLGGLK